MRMPQTISLACAAASALQASLAIEATGNVVGHLRPHVSAGFLDTGKLHLNSNISELDDHIWTFAYAANIGKSKLESAGIHPRTTLAATLPQHALIFDGELGSNGHLGGRNFFTSEEKAFANVQRVKRPTELAPAIGVVHEITPKELKILDASEQPIMHRELMNLQVEGKNGPYILPAWTYVSKDYDSIEAPDANLGIHTESAPSARYARLVVCGAEERHLPKSYTNKLRNHLQHLGLASSSLDCSKPLEPLVAHGMSHPKAQAAQVPVTGTGMVTSHKAVRTERSNFEAMEEFLFPKTSIDENR